MSCQNMSWRMPLPESAFRAIRPTEPEHRVDSDSLKIIIYSLSRE